MFLNNEIEIRVSWLLWPALGTLDPPYLSEKTKILNENNVPPTQGEKLTSEPIEYLCSIF